MESTIHLFIVLFFWLRPRGTWLKLERNVVKGLIIHRPNYDKKSLLMFLVFFIIMSGPEMFQSTKQSTIGDKVFETLSSDGVTLKSKTIQSPPPRSLPVPLHPKLMCLLFSTGSLSIALRGWGRESLIFLCLSQQDVRKAQKESVSQQILSPDCRLVKR